MARKRKGTTLLSFFIILFLLGAGLSLGWAYYLLSPGQSGAKDQVFTVHKGETLKVVAHTLAENRLIRYKSLFLLWARVRGDSGKIKAGEYSLNADMPPLRILHVLRQGIVITHAVTIPEGYTILQIRGVFAENKLIDPAQFMNAALDPEMVKKYNLSGPTLEGYLYPDTYYFSEGLTSEKVIDVMVKRFMREITPLGPRIQQCGLSLVEIVTLASIVEKETGLGTERPIIASVFLNRLKKGMRLESDPTVIYDIKDFDGNIRRKDLQAATPYNTYVIRGLPPGPIANPGIDSIKAVLEPANTNYLFFVSKNNGSHHFSETFQEHIEAVNKYQRNREQ